MSIRGYEAIYGTLLWYARNDKGNTAWQVRLDADQSEELVMETDLYLLIKE